MKARGQRWVLEPGTYPCACGTSAVYIRNCKSGERLSKAHRAPDGKACPEFEWQEAVERTRRIEGRAQP